MSVPPRCCERTEEAVREEREEVITAEVVGIDELSSKRPGSEGSDDDDDDGIMEDDREVRQELIPETAQTA